MIRRNLQNNKHLVATNDITGILTGFGVGLLKLTSALHLVEDCLGVLLRLVRDFRVFESGL